MLFRKLTSLVSGVAIATTAIAAHPWASETELPNLFFSKLDVEYGISSQDFRYITIDIKVNEDNNFVTYRCQPTTVTSPLAGRCIHTSDDNEVISFRVREPLPQFIMPYPNRQRGEIRRWLERYVSDLNLEPYLSGSLLLDINYTPLL